MNLDELVTVAVMGQIAHPTGAATPYRIGHDGIPRVLPGTGGIVLSHRIGDRCVGLMSDHLEPGVSIRNQDRSLVGGRHALNLALMTYACVGNCAQVVTGPAAGAWGLVTGKHGGINHVLIDFPPRVLRALRIGDRIQVRTVGLGLRLLRHPEVTVLNCAPALIARWGIRESGSGLSVPVTHRIPASIMGSGLGKNSGWRGDWDVQLADPVMRRRHRLGTLRFGDMVAICHADNRFGPSYRRGRTTIGVVIHGDSTVSGHGPGITPLLTAPESMLQLVHEPRANLARIFNLRALPPARDHRPLAISSTR